MKIMTLNAHSLSEKNGDEKRRLTAQCIHEWKPDVIALQEVNQKQDADVIRPNSLYVGNACIKADNYAQALTDDLLMRKDAYQWTWLPIKLGYDIYEEGLAILTTHTISKQESILLSSVDDFSNWKTRKTIGVLIDESYWVYSVHMGWWHDDTEPFLHQWNVLQDALKDKKETIILAGDFNAPAEISDQSYNAVIQSGWVDTYACAETTIGEYTVAGSIDGWKNAHLENARMDHIFCNRNMEVKRSEVVFDGKDSPVVSDHFGILMEGNL